MFKAYIHNNMAQRFRVKLQSLHHYSITCTTNSARVDSSQLASRWCEAPHPKSILALTNALLGTAPKPKRKDLRQYHTVHISQKLASNRVRHTYLLPRRNGLRRDRTCVLIAGTKHLRGRQATCSTGLTQCAHLIPATSIVHVIFHVCRSIHV